MDKITKAIICGGRDFIPNNDHKLWLVETIQLLNVKCIICGMAKGADMFGYQIAKELNLPVMEYRAEWEKHGKAAGYLRNYKMAEVADLCIAFKGGNGTKSMIKISKDKNIPVIVCNF